MDPVSIAALIGGGADILGGVIGSSGQAAANRSNERIAKDNQAFQERMSSTAYQRSAKDLEAAGLNRILALGSPSSSPGGSTATMQNEKAALGRGVSKAAHSAMSLRTQQQNLKNMIASEAQAASAANLNNEKSITEQDQQANLRQQWSLISAQAANMREQMGLTTAKAESERYGANIRSYESALYDQIGPLLQTLKSTIPALAPAINLFQKV